MAENSYYAKTEETQKATIQSILTSLPIIREASLTIFREVPVKDMKYKEKSYLEVPKIETELGDMIRNDLTIDFLICKREKILLAVQLKKPYSFLNENEENELDQLPGISFLSIPFEETLNRRTEELLEGWIRRKLENQESWPCSYEVCFIKREQYPLYLKARLLEEYKLLETWKEKKWEKVIMKPSRYGAAEGVVKGWYVSKEKKLYQGLFYSRNRKESVWQAVNSGEGEQTPDTKVNERLSFAERIRRVDASYGVMLMKRFAKVPVYAYLQDDSQEMIEFQNILNQYGLLKEEVTYQEAAVLAYQLMQEKKTKQTGRKIMCQLARMFF